MKKQFFVGVVAATAILFAQSSPTTEHVKPAGTQIAVDTFPMTARVTPDKKFLLVLNGGINPPSVSAVDIASAKEVSRAPVPDAWLGLAINRAGDRIYVGGGSKASVYEFTFAAGILKPSRVFPVVDEKSRKPEDFIGDVQLAPDGHLLYAADLYRDSIVVINPQSGLILSRIKTGKRPYRIVFHPSGKSLYVSSWTEGSVGRFNPDTGERIGTVRVAPQPTDMVWSESPVDEQPAVKGRLFVSASNTNSVYAFGASESGDLTRLESINLAMTPRQPLGMTPRGLGLSADGTKLFVACADANTAAIVDIAGPRSHLIGFVPTSAYPMAAFGMPDGRMAVLNGGSGSVQLVNVSDEAALIGSTKGVLADSPYRDEKLDDPGIPAGNPVRPNGPIKHVIYIVKATGGLNQAAAAGTVNRAIAAIAPAYTESMWRNSSAGRRLAYDYEGQEAANAPPAGYLWTAASQAGVTMRNYGFFVDNRATPEADGTQITGIRDPILAPVTDPNYRGPDPTYSDVERAKEFVSELQDFGKEGVMPQLLLVRLGNDSDAAVTMIVEALSNSRFWPESAVFAVSTGPGSPAFVASPWVKRPPADARVYNELSVLRTVEIILGLHPLTTWDAAARPMFDLFTDAPRP